MKQQGRTAKAPIKEAFGSWKNVRLMIIVMFGCVAGVSAVGAMGLIYPLLFLLQTLKVDSLTTNVLAMLAIGVTIPLFPLVGWLSDRIGRKPMIISACLLAAASYFPVVKALAHFANPAYEAALASAPISVAADPAECSFVFNPTGTSKFLSSCDIVTSTLAREGVNYAKVAGAAKSGAQIMIGKTTVAGFDGTGLASAELKAKQDAFTKDVRAAIRAAGYPAKADPAQTNLVMVWLLMVYMAALMPLAYGASTAVMVELFPARIRYTTLSVPYHIGNWVSGFLIPIVFAMVAFSGDIYFGLWYPITWAVFSAIVVALFVPETKDREIQGWY